MALDSLTYILLVICAYGITTQDATSSKTTPSSTTATSSERTTFIPDTFYYNCTKNGGIQIANKNITFKNVRILNNTSNNCSIPVESDRSGTILIANCTMNSTVDIALENANESSIVGGYHFKTFRIRCDQVNLMPYFLNVTARENFSVPPTARVINMATTPTPAPISKMAMTINNGNKNVGEATIGQALTIAITIPDKVTIKPTECEATGNGHSVILWQENGCHHNSELFGEKWTNSPNQTVTNTMYGFRFVGTSNSITIMCNVRVCPEGYKGNACQLGCTQSKRKRVHRLPSDVKTKTLTTSLSIKDSLLTNGSGRLDSKLNHVIGLFAIAFGYATAKFIRG